MDSNTVKNEEYVLTIWGCLCAVMMDYGINFDHMTPRMGELFANDLMELLEKSGYIKKEVVKNDLY